MKNQIPEHLAIIMDGNRRWAKARKKPPIFGHKEGYRRVLEIGEACRKKGVKTLTVYAFSTENWKRSKTEVSFLLSFLRKVLNEQLEKLHKEKIKICVLGRIKELPKDLQNLIQRAMELTKDNSDSTLNLAINYGGRTEIVDALKNIVKKNIPSDKINEQIISENLYTTGQKDPDFLIRTSGEQRLSNFLLWQMAYSELYFSKVLWPDFTMTELNKALAEYGRRQRRFGE